MTNEKTGNQAPEHHPTLKMASLEIYEILKKHDIAGICVIHTVGFKELVTRIDPSYSCIKLNELRQLQIIKPIEDPLNPEQAAKPVVDTITMLSHMGAALMQLSNLCSQSVIAVRMTFGMLKNEGLDLTSKPTPPNFINGKKRKG